ncbi:MAG: hypothetical protein KAI99_09245 [Cyclobacteriaceae bacterium]|nr:hypothetical protein [Cyclobacteriaceae bacterium]MCK5468684.1 hypothetical protein [Cyclobacteriaceae bacterium]MCK5705438.1 hypothetical protein [Cyclobacteriaceae bacterium]
MMKILSLLLALSIGYLIPGVAQTGLLQSEEPPVVPVGEQAYLHCTL